MSRSQALVWLRPATLSPLVLLIYALVLILVQGSPLVLVTPGSDFAPSDMTYSYTAEGYDGQFTYYIARDGLAAEPNIDVPAYRFQRILLPLLGNLLAFGQVGLLPWTLLLVNLLALVGSTWLLEQMLVERRVSRWYALGYALSVAGLGAARLNTPETLAYALVIGGVYLAEKDHWWAATVIFALSLFAKETTIFFPAAYGLYWLINRHWLRAFSVAIVVLVPLALWQIWLYAQFEAFGIGSGGAMATSFEWLPFAGYVRIFLEANLPAAVLLSIIIVPFVIVPALWSLWQVSGRIRQGEWSLVTLYLGFNALIFLFIPFSTYREPLGILRFVAGLHIALLLYAAQQRRLRALRLSTLWAVPTLLIIVSDFAA